MSSRTLDRPSLGILLMLGFCVLAPLGDATAKFIGDRVPLGELLLVRFVTQVVLLTPLIWLMRLPWRMTGRVFWLTALRSILHILGIGAMFTSLKFLPLADAIAIAFVMPFIMLFLGKYVLGEEVGARRIIAAVVGFIGTLLVVQPSFAEVGTPALLPLFVALVFALFMLTTRAIAKEVDPIALQAVSGAMASLFLIPLLVIGQSLRWPAAAFLAPVGFDIALLIFIGVLGTLAHLLMTWSLRFAPSATLAPMQYLEIPFATIIGFLVFRDLPNGLAAIGIAITIGAGLYVILREQATARAQKAARPRIEPAPPAAE